jgi:hypothetical protein
MDAEGLGDTSGISTTELFDGIRDKVSQFTIVINIETPWRSFWRTSQTCN